MSEATNPVEQELNFLEMSDEDILNMESPTAVVADPAAADPVDPAPVDPVDPAEPVDPIDPAEPVDPVDPVEADNADPVDPAPVASAAPVVPVDPKAADPVKDPVDPAGKPGDAPQAAEPAPADAIDYKAAYEQLFAPFKANGREIKVTSVDDAIALMQMGANYNKKMAALKPNLRLMKMLENNGLLSEEKLSFLIDLDKKNPAAISRLVKDSGVDPLDLGAEQASAYKQTTYTVDDREVELDAVLDEIQSTPSYSKTLDVVSNKWDGPSKQTIATAPAILKVINAHMESGVYDVIAAEVENERLFGRLTGLSDIEAYRKVGDAIQARGGFNHLFAATADKQATTPASPVTPAPAPKTVDDGKLKDKKRAASSTRPVASVAPAAADFNPLALSDEEIAKMAVPKYS